MASSSRPSLASKVPPFQRPTSPHSAAQATQLGTTGTSSPLLVSQVHELDVACAELKSLHPTRAVFEKRGAIFFRTTVKAAAKSQQKELEIAKARAKKASS